LTAAHHLNLAHGRAVSALRALVPSACQLSITLNLMQVEPATDSELDRAAAQHVDDISNGVFLRPILRGAYEDRLIADTQHFTDWAFVRGGDLVDIAAPIDLLGVNYYSPTKVAAVVKTDAGSSPVVQLERGRHMSSAAVWPGTDLACSVPQPGPMTDMGWAIHPNGLTRLLARLHRDYPDMPLVVTENGAAYADSRSADGDVHDPDRIAYVRDHLLAVHEAIDAGVDVRGYYVWSLLDNFEWAWGYQRRFGIVFVDFETQRRIPKQSAKFYTDVVRANAVPPLPLDAVV